MLALASVMHVVFLIAIFLCGSATKPAPPLTLSGALATKDLSNVEAVVDREFSDVPQISTADLARRIDENPPLLLDARQPGEYEVSHITGAVRIDPSATDLTGVSKGRAIVVYCSVGWRSSKLARRLRQAGYSDVSNLRGSIFRWALENRPLESNGRNVCVVHPFDESWGALLPARLRAPM